jgi:hypothetical protein
VVSIDRLLPSASLLCPLLFYDGQTQPDYLRFSRSSLWETSAVQAAAAETLSLPSRLHRGQRAAMSMAETEQLFAQNGPGQTIVRAELSAEDTRRGASNGHGHGHAAPARGGDDDPRMRGRFADDGDRARLDLQFLPDLAIAGLRPKTFATLDVLRGNDRAWGAVPDSPRTANPADDGFDVVRRHLATRLKFPQPSSYPAVFRDADVPPSAGAFGVGCGDGGGDGRGGVGVGSAGRASDMVGGLPVRARMVADTGVAGWLRRFGLRARLLGPELREEVTDNLLAAADRYVEGWEEGEGREEDFDDGDDEMD